jgi:hypothetical protein
MLNATWCSPGRLRRSRLTRRPPGAGPDAVRGRRAAAAVPVPGPGEKGVLA